MNAQNQHKGHHRKSSGHQKRNHHGKFGNKPFEKLGKDYEKQNKDRGGFMELEPKKIEDDEQFIDHAKKIAQKLEDGGKTQIRKFYDEFKTAIDIDSPNIFKLRMLLPKIHYQNSRRGERGKVLKDKMAQFLRQLIEWTVKSEELEQDKKIKQLERAKSFFTAVYGFYGEGKNHTGNKQKK